jgi:HEAT repeat protein
MQQFLHIIELKHPQLEYWLIRLATGQRWSIRRKAIFYLGEIRSHSAIALISVLMSDGDAGIRAEAREAILKIRTGG